MDDDELIREFIAKRGVTRCPTAFAEESSATPHPADAAAHAARGLDPVGDAWRAKHPMGGSKNRPFHFGHRRKGVGRTTA